MSEEFIGSGWSFPVDIDATGSVVLLSREREIEKSIWLILATAPGERPMRPEFGCAIHDEVFAGIDGLTAGRIASEVRASRIRWDPRIEVQDVVVSPDGSRDGHLQIDVRYSLTSTNDPR